MTTGLFFMFISFRTASLKEPKNKNSKRKRETNVHKEDEGTPTENVAESNQPNVGKSKKRKKKNWELRITDSHLKLMFKIISIYDARTQLQEISNITFQTNQTFHHFCQLLTLLHC